MCALPFDHMLVKLVFEWLLERNIDFGSLNATGSTKPTEALKAAEPEMFLSLSLHSAFQAVVTAQCTPCVSQGRDPC